MRIFVRFKLFLIETKLTINVPKVFREIRAVLNEEQLWKGMERKSYLRRLLENIWWYIKHKEACIFYNSYGFDIKKFRNKKEYISYRRFRVERYLEDYPKNIYESKLFALRNKVVFSSYFGSLLGERFLPKTVAIINPDGSLFDYCSKQKVEINTFFANPHDDLFIKKINGECGDGCYLLKSGEDPAQLLRDVKGSTFLIQERINQHPDINKINPSCVNTIRIITIVGRKTKKPHVFAQYMRVGCGLINDNVATGGVRVGIDKNGIMGKYGVGHHLINTKHPITNHIYEGTHIPFIKEVEDLVLLAHSFILDVPTIGWDVAITPQGPVLIEGNDNWEISGPQDVFGGMKKKWYELHKK